MCELCETYQPQGHLLCDHQMIKKKVHLLQIKSAITTHIQEFLENFDLIAQELILRLANGLGNEYFG